MYIRIFIVLYCVVNVCSISWAAHRLNDKHIVQMPFLKEALPYLVIRSATSYKDDPLFHQYNWKEQANKTYAGSLKFEYYPKDPSDKS